MKKINKQIVCTLAFLILATSLVGCNKKKQEEKIVNTIPPVKMETTEEKNDNKINEDEIKEITYSNLSHNVYLGTIGEKSVLVDLYVDDDTEEGTVTIINLKEDELNYPPVDFKDKRKVEYKDEYSSFILYGKGEDKIGGIVHLDGEQLFVNLSLSHIVTTGNVKDRYSMGNTMEVEKVAKIIKEAVLSDDMNTLADYVYYPISIPIEEGATAKNKQAFIDMGAHTICTDNLKEALRSSFDKFMFSNYEGIMIGSGEYNIWLTVIGDESEKDLKSKYAIIAINCN